VTGQQLPATIGLYGGRTVVLTGWTLDEYANRHYPERPRVHVIGWLTPESLAVADAAVVDYQRITGADFPGREVYGPADVHMDLTSSWHRSVFVGTRLQLTWVKPRPLPPGDPDHDPACLYCAHGPACVLCEPSGTLPTSDTYVCQPCRESILHREISADPYFRGDDYAMFGDAG